MASKEKLEHLYNILNKVIPGNVHYSLNVANRVYPPFIVYQQLNNRGTKYADDSTLMRLITFQLTLVTKDKEFDLTKKLENELMINDLSYQMINEYYLVDIGLYRIYEIKMEEFKYEQ